MKTKLINAVAWFLGWALFVAIQVGFWLYISSDWSSWYGYG